MDYDPHTFLVLTAARLGEVRRMQWDEVDWENALWRVPAAHMKRGRDHVVPLSKPALRILRDARKRATGGKYVFGSGRSPMGNSTMGDRMKRRSMAGSPHGYRASFKTWCRANGVDELLSELPLAHVESGTVQAYGRSTGEERRDLMEAWAKHCMSGMPEGTLDRFIG